MRKLDVFFSVEKGKMTEDIITLYSCLKGGYREENAGLFAQVQGYRLSNCSRIGKFKYWPKCKPSRMYVEDIER